MFKRCSLNTTSDSEIYPPGKYLCKQLEKIIFSDYLGSTEEEVSDPEKMSPRLDEDSEFFLRGFFVAEISSTAPDWPRALLVPKRAHC